MPNGPRPQHHGLVDFFNGKSKGAYSSWYLQRLAPVAPSRLILVLVKQCFSAPISVDGLFIPARLREDGHGAFTVGKMAFKGMGINHLSTNYNHPWVSESHLSKRPLYKQNMAYPPEPCSLFLEMGWTNFHKLRYIMKSASHHWLATVMAVYTRLPSINAYNRFFRCNYIMMIHSINGVFLEIYNWQPYFCGQPFLWLL